MQKSGEYHLHQETTLSNTHEVQNWHHEAPYLMYTMSSLKYFCPTSPTPSLTWIQLWESNQSDPNWETFCKTKHYQQQNMLVGVLKARERLGTNLD